MAAKFDWISVLLIILKFTNGINTDVVTKACAQNPNLPYCRNSENSKSKYLSTPNDPFDKTSVQSTTIDPDFKAKFVYNDDEEQLRVLDDYNDPSVGISPTTEYNRIIAITKPTRHRHRFTVTPSPTYRPNLFYAIFPQLQPKDGIHFCVRNEYRFQVTCRPGKKIRYDLRLFCQDYAEMCGVPNINLYPSRFAPLDDGRPVGYGQKQKNGHIGLGNSFSLGLGVVPGFEFVNSQGVDIGSLPYLENTDGLIVNTGQDIGILGQRIGKGPARTMKTLTRGFPISTNPRDDVDSRKEKIKALRALGVPPQIGKALSVLSPSAQNVGRRRIGYEPGFGAVNRRSFLATGKTDDDSVIVPGMGEIELVKGIGLAVG